MFFYMLLLEQNNITKSWQDKNRQKLNIDDNDDKEYKVKAICNSAVYRREL